jgi:hypothetical protein
MARSRVRAERWSIPTNVGRPAVEALADPAVGDLVSPRPPGGGLQTVRTLEYLRWRYGFEPLHYRAIGHSNDLTDGLAIFRLRSRGSATEAALVETLVPRGDAGADGRLAGAVAAAAEADYVIRLGGPPADRNGFLRIPRQGPVLTWRPLHDGLPGAELADWQLSLGDVELF